MARFGVFLLTLFNIGGLIVSSMLAAAGGGSEKYGWAVLILGGIWTLVFTYAAWAMCARGESGLGLLMAFLTWPAASLIGMVVKWGALVISDLQPSAPEFALACKSAGPRYLTKPTTPVRSIAYEWEGSGPPFLNRFQIASSGRIASSSYHMPMFPSTIEFTEARCCVHAGRPSNGVGPYVRQPNGNSSPNLRVAELASDALVAYKISNTELSKGFALRHVDLTVSDRRNGQTLATLRYISDVKNGKMCGTTSDGVMDETAFVQRAIGLN